MKAGASPLTPHRSLSVSHAQARSLKQEAAENALVYITPLQRKDKHIRELQIETREKEIALELLEEELNRVSGGAGRGAAGPLGYRASGGAGPQRRRAGPRMGLPGGWWCGAAGGATGRVVGRRRRTGPRGGAVVGVIGRCRRRSYRMGHRAVRLGGAMGAEERGGGGGGGGGGGRGGGGGGGPSG